MYYCYHDTPIGELLLAGDEDTLRVIGFPEGSMRREPDERMWAAIVGWTDASRGTAMVNTIGAAATIARAHAHLTPERLGFLPSLPERAGPPDLVGQLQAGSGRTHHQHAAVG